MYIFVSTCEGRALFARMGSTQNMFELQAAFKMSQKSNLEAGTRA